jgi:hypothetical protein
VTGHEQEPANAKPAEVRYRGRIIALTVLLLIFAVNWYGTHRRVASSQGEYFGGTEFAEAESFFRYCSVITGVLLFATAGWGRNARRPEKALALSSVSATRKIVGVV